MGCSEWREVELSDFVDIKHGYAYKGKDFSSEETNRILLTPGNFNIGGGFKDDKFKYYSESAINPSDYILEPNDLLVTMTDLSKTGDTLGFPILIPDLEKKMILHNQRTGRIIMKSSEIDKIFMYYLFCTREYRHHVLSTSTGTTVHHTAPKRIESYKFLLPPLNEQKAIAKILSTLDEKIEINKKTNKNLEETAQAIFKHWFVDFEFPNEDRKPYKSSGGEMAESELGMIPEEWEIGLLDDIIEISSGKRPKKKVKEPEGDFVIPLIGASSIMGFVEEYNYNESILVMGRVGTHGIIQRFNNMVWASDNTLVIKSKYYEYVHQLLKVIDYSSLNRGSTQPLITQTDIKNTNIILPSLEILKEYEVKIGLLYKLVEKNHDENNILVELRDTLLPKLMSGEIRVPLKNK